MISYKQILADLSSIAYHHEQIMSFGFGDIEQCTNDITTKQEPKYTRMYVVPKEVVFNQNQIHYNFAIIVMDKVEEDLSNLTDVMSDTIEIAKDVWTVFYQSYTQQYGNFSNYIVGDWNPDLIPFTERFETILAGHTMHIALSVPFDYSECGLPIEFGFGFPLDESFESYRVVIEDFREFAALHEQINSFGYGDIHQITNDITTKQEPKYIRMYVLPETTQLAENHMHIGFRVIFCDKVEEDQSNQQDVLNDTLEVAKDFFSLLYLSEYEADWNPQLEPFLERYETILGGWSMTFNIIQKFDFNRCVLPLTPFNYPWEVIAQMWENIATDWNDL